ncbi:MULTISPECIES: DUF4270 family protein [unclassified Saccharicrinis]|uniref:DUF4270 family protein n=1 Tax=unclassified Saccharicrinis TaxID=2646859 RepID=UPI003D333908
MQTQNIFQLRVLQTLTFAVAVLFLSSCNDDPAEIAANLFGDNLIDTEFSVSSGTELTASNFILNVESQNPVQSFIIGEYSDSIYGQTAAGFLAQFANVTSGFTEEASYDSTQLKIAYTRNKWLGDPYSKNKITIYELTSKVPSQNLVSTQFNPSGLFDEANPIGALEFMYELTDAERDSLLTEEERESTLEDDEKLDLAWSKINNTRTLTIDIDDAIGAKIFNAGEDVITDDESLEQVIKGIYVRSESVDGNRGNLGFANSTSLYVHGSYTYIPDSNQMDVIDTAIVTKSFGFGQENKKIQFYNNDYTESVIDFNSANVDKMYLQGLGGTMAKVNISDEFIEKWRSILPDPDEEIDENDPITSLASVELSFYIDIDTTITDYNDNLPQTIYLYIKNSEGEFESPVFNLNASIESAAFSNAVFSETEEGAYKYTFTLESGFFETLIDDTPKYPINGERNYKELYLSVADVISDNVHYTFDRVALHGMSITPSEQDVTIQPSNITIKYVEIE